MGRKRKGYARLTRLSNLKRIKNILQTDNFSTVRFSSDEHKFYCIECEEYKPIDEFDYQEGFEEFNCICKVCENVKRNIGDAKRVDLRRRSQRKSINKYVDGYEYHHFIFDKNGNLDPVLGAYVPKEIHRAIYHNHKTCQGMLKINKLIWKYLEST